MPPPPSEPTPTVAVVGCGAWGRNHVRAFNAQGALAAVADASAAAADAAAAAAGVPARALAEILGDPMIAAVVIATPDALHAAIARQVLDAGKHALVEKPMALTVADAEDLAARALARGLVLMTGHILRYHAGFRRLHQLVAEGALGRPLHIAARRLHLTPGAPRHALWDLCPHDISMILALAGGLPLAVRGLVTATEGEIPQAGAVTLEFGGGGAAFLGGSRAERGGGGAAFLGGSRAERGGGAAFLGDSRAERGGGGAAFLGDSRAERGGGLNAEISFSEISPVKLHQLTVSGSDAQAVFEDSKPWPEKLALYRPGLDALRIPAARQAVALVPGEPLAEQARAFLSAIAGGPQPESAAPEAIAVVRVLAAAARAVESGRPEAP